MLADGITQTGTMLREAETAQASIDANQAPGTPVDKKDDAAVRADTQRGNRLAGAQGDLSSVVARFHTLMEEINHTADDVANKIDDASHDDLKDSWWDSHVRAWIHDHADLLKMVADVLTWIATAIVIVVLIVGTGGIGLAMLLTAGALLIHTMLAANGDGSWVDVAIDAFALVTMGAGKALTGGAKTALALREGGAAFSETSTAAREAFTSSSGFVSRAGTWLSQGNVVARNLRGAAAGIGKFSEVLNTEFTGASWMSRLAFGEKGAAGLYKAINESISRLGTGVLLNTARSLMNVSRATFVTGTAVDLTAKVFNDADLGVFRWDGVRPWVEWKEEHTIPRGGYW